MKIVIIGVGTSAMATADILIADHNFSVAGFIGTIEENKLFSEKKIYNNIPYLGDKGILKKIKEDDVVGFIAAVGDRYLRENAYYEASVAGLTPINAISKNAFIEPTVKLGKGVIVSTGSILLHGVVVGNNCYIDSGAIIEINTKIGENCNISTGCIIGGNSEIERNVSVGIRSTIYQNIKIGKNQDIEPSCICKNNFPPLDRADKIKNK
jgi:UDP-perosamine 4-acetyltransferase